jgi:hypothetical protein
MINQKIIGFEGIQFSDNLVAQPSQSLISTRPSPAKIQLDTAGLEASGDEMLISNWPTCLWQILANRPCSCHDMMYMMCDGLRL